ncbi:MAG: hypothetical protein NVSMB27_47470 [Ktedonobacteraceae bacterium]
MGKNQSYKMTAQQIERETDAEVAFGRFLERSGVDADEFMAQWKIAHSQFIAISHFVYGLSDDISSLPNALAALLKATRDHSLAA